MQREFGTAAHADTEKLDRADTAASDVSNLTSFERRTDDHIMDEVALRGC